MVLVCLWNLGTGFGLSHNSALAATLPDVAKVLLMILMLVGRLELIISISLHPQFLEELRTVLFKSF